MSANNITEFGFCTRAIHAGQHPDPTTGAVMTPIYQTSTYAQYAPGKPYSEYEYSRTANPTRSALENNLASLENAQFGLAFSSGCAALSTLLHTFTPGDHVLVGDDVYGGTFRLFDKVFKQFGIEYTLADFTDPTHIAQHIKNNTKLVWLETPTNPLLKIFDIAAISEHVKNINPSIYIAVDNTFATPYLQTPLSLGADIVCHSTTKYIGGHSDIIGGALLTNHFDLCEKLKFYQNAIGAVPSPQDCFLLLRSTKTLALRMQKHCMNAHAIALFLEQHPKVERVIYPGLVSHPQHHLAGKQMRLFGGMISFYLRGDKQDALSFLEKLSLFTVAESLGGVESLIEHPGIMTHAAIPETLRAQSGITDNFIRISVGIEEEEDLIKDLDDAL